MKTYRIDFDEIHGTYVEAFSLADALHKAFTYETIGLAIFDIFCVGEK
jgi:hypothetical protein